MLFGVSICLHVAVVSHFALVLQFRLCHSGTAIVPNSKTMKPLAQGNFLKRTHTHTYTQNHQQNSICHHFLSFFKLPVSYCCFSTSSKIRQSQHSVRHSYSSRRRHVRMLDASLCIKLPIYSHFLPVAHAQPLDADIVLALWSGENSKEVIFRGFLYSSTFLVAFFSVFLL